MALRLQIRGPNNKPIRLALPADASYASLVDHVRSSFPQIPDFILHVGVPPKIQEIDGSNPSAKLTTIGIRSGDTVIIELGGNGTVMVQGSGWDLPPTVDERASRAVHYKVPGDNSCLFHAIGAALLRKNPSVQSVSEIKTTIKKEILAKPKEWDVNTLGESPQSYLQQMENRNFWGGGIEIAIISAHYQVEIAVVDFAALCVTTFAHYPEEGSNTEGYKRRIYLFYDGSNINSAHYDLGVITGESSRASALTGMSAGSAETDTQSSFDSSLQSIFRPADEAALNLIKRIAELGHDQLVSNGRTTKKTWTQKDMIKSKNKKPAFQGKSGALGETANVTNHMDFAPKTNTTTTTPTAPSTITPVVQPKPTVTPTPTTTTATTTTASKPAAAAPATASGLWPCEVCTFANIAARTLCEMCDTPRPRNVTPATVPVQAPAPVAAKPKVVEQPKPVTVAPVSQPRPTNPTPAPAPVQKPVQKPVQQPVQQPKPSPVSPTSTASSATAANRPWTCVSCTYSNRPSSTKCDMCESSRDESTGGRNNTSAKPATQQAKPAATPAEVMSANGQQKAEDWECSQCKARNNGQSTKCNQCGTKKADCSIM